MYSNERRRQQQKSRQLAKHRGVVKIQEANECLSIWLHNKYSFNCFPRPTHSHVWSTVYLCQFHFIAMIVHRDILQTLDCTLLDIVVGLRVFCIVWPPKKIPFAKLPIDSQVFISLALPLLNSFDLSYSLFLDFSSFHLREIGSILCAFCPFKRQTFVYATTNRFANLGYEIEIG